VGVEETGCSALEPSSSTHPWHYRQIAAESKEGMDCQTASRYSTAQPPELPLSRPTRAILGAHGATTLSSTLAAPPPTSASSCHTALPLSCCYARDTSPVSRAGSVHLSSCFAAFSQSFAPSAPRYERRQRLWKDWLRLPHAATPGLPDVPVGQALEEGNRRPRDDGLQTVLPATMAPRA